MPDWQIPQLIVLFFFASRALNPPLIRAFVGPETYRQKQTDHAMKKLADQDKPHGFAIGWMATRILDGIWLLLLTWGGFF